MTFVHRRVLIGINSGGGGSIETGDWTSTGSATGAWQPVLPTAFADTAWAMVVTDGASEYFSAQAEADTAWAMVVTDGADEYFSPQVEADTAWAMVVLQHKQWEPKGVATVTWDGEDATP